MDWFLPGDKAGGPVRSVYSLIKALQDKIEFYVMTMNTDIFSDKEYSLKANEWTDYDGMNVFYFSKDFFSANTFLKVISDVQAHVIYINSFWSFRFSILPLLLKKLNKISIPIILAPRGMLESGALNIKSFKKNLFLVVSKWIGLHKGILFHATSEDEKKAILKLFPNNPTVVISNLSFLNHAFQEISKEKGILKLFYLSRICEVKNLHFAIQVLSKISIPVSYKIEYHIYGNNEEKEYFRYCKELAKQLPPNIEYVYKGVLNFQEVSNTLYNYHALFLPTKNENFGHAIVETLSCGRPVIISNRTPWNDVNDFNCGYALDLKEEEFISVIHKMLEMENEEYQKMCVNAKTYIEQKLNKDFIVSEYLKLFEYAAKSTHN